MERLRQSAAVVSLKFCLKQLNIVVIIDIIDTILAYNIIILTSTFPNHFLFHPNNDTFLMTFLFSSVPSLLKVKSNIKDKEIVYFVICNGLILNAFSKGYRSDKKNLAIQAPSRSCNQGCTFESSGRDFFLNANTIVVCPIPILSDSLR